jgi:hypothetical protein
MKIGDNVYCIRPYIDTEVPRSFIPYCTNGILIHTTQDKQYKINNILTLPDKRLGWQIIQGTLKDEIYIEIKNNFNVFQWYELKRFASIKEYRKLKLQKLNSF